MTKQHFDQIQIASPCNAEWDSMIGNNQVRFCKHCNFKVHNLSEMTSRKAMRLVADSRGRLCVRFTEGPDGLPVTKLPAKLHRITARASRIAAGAFTAALTVSSAVAQTRPSPTGDRTNELVVQTPQKPASTSQEPNAANLNLEQRHIEELPRNGRLVTTGMMVMRKPELPLVDAAAKNDLEAVKKLLYAGSDVNLVDPVTRSTALVHAVENGNREMVQLLLAAGAKVRNANKNDRIALNSLDVDATPELVADLLAAGARVNQRDEHGSTPLLNAANSSSLAVVELLIKAGARSDVRDDNGETVLMRAAINDDPNVLKFFLDSGFAVNAQDKEGSTTLMHAVSAANTAAVKLLLDPGAEVNVQDQNGNTPLLLAAVGERAEILRFLIAAGGEIDVRDGEGQTPLLAAATDGTADNLRLLLAAGAALDACDDEGQTALMLAVSSRDVDKVKILLRAGADSVSRDKEGKTALTLARENDNDEIIKLLLSRGARQ